MSSGILGFDIGGTAIKIGFFSEQGELIRKWQIPARLENRGEYILPDIIASAEKVMQEQKTGWNDISGIGIGVPGPVLDKSRVILASNIGWRDLNVRDAVRSLTGVEHIVAENDAKTAALGEYRKGGWDTYRSAVMITLGTAVGGAVILDGKIVTGAFGAAGELSHIQVNPSEKEPCACGKYGHLQQYASSNAIIDAFRKKAGPIGLSELSYDSDHLTVKDVFDAAKAGNAAALETVDTAVRMIARTMACVSAVIDPELFLIGGGISKAGDFLLNRIREDFREIALSASENARIEAAKLGNDAGIYGAAGLVLDQDSRNM